MNHIGIEHKLETNKQKKLCKVMITVIFQKTMLKYNSNRSICFLNFILCSVFSTRFYNRFAVLKLKFE